MDPLVLGSANLSLESWESIKNLWNSPRRQLRRKLQAAIGTTPDDIEATFRSLIAECDLNAFDTRRSSRWWGRAYYMLGLPAAVLAVVAGATGLASTAGRIPAAIIALVAAGLVAAVTFLNSEDNQRRNSAMSAAWSELADDARLHNLSYTQAIRDSVDDSDKVKVVIDDYWARILKLHRRKVVLLRGEVYVSG
jgi:hypothetical protein